MHLRSPRSPLSRRSTAAAVLGVALLVGVAACGDGDDGGEGEARDRTSDADSSPASTPSTGTATPATPGPGSYPAFQPEDYTYRLEVVCYCPQVGAVRVKVADGEVVSATTTGAGRGVQKGAEAPEFARLTINDIIEVANDAQVDSAEVSWPDGQDHPSVVKVDRIAEATDDEVTYTIKNVRVR